MVHDMPGRPGGWKAQGPRCPVNVKTMGPLSVCCLNFPFPLLPPVPSDCGTEHSFTVPPKCRSLKQAPNPRRGFWSRPWFLCLSLPPARLTGCQGLLSLPFQNVSPISPCTTHPFLLPHSGPHFSPEWVQKLPEIPNSGPSSVPMIFHTITG